MQGPADTRLLHRIRQDVVSMQAYAVQDSRGMLKLDAMENPYRLPLALQAELGQRLGAVPFNRYPGQRIDDLRRALSDFAAMPPGYDILLGNGSDELISMLAMACDVPPDPISGSRPVVLAPVPGFVMYAASARLQGLEFVGVPLTAEFALDEPAMLHAIAVHRPALVFLAHPNNPTTALWDADTMARLVAAAGATDSLVIIDEAYQPFARRTYLDIIRADPAGHGHVMLMRTMSKFGLAGVRIGYLLGPVELIAQIDKVRPPYNVSTLNCECALFALEHAEVFAEQAAHVRAQRERVLHALRLMPAVHAWNSDANMILARFAGAATRAREVFDGLRERGVLVKNVSLMHPLLANCLRMTVGTEEENTRLLQALEETL
jgi:histidinol-phosphate aminotransferase